MHDKRVIFIFSLGKKGANYAGIFLNNNSTVLKSKVL